MAKPFSLPNPFADFWQKLEQYLLDLLKPILGPIQGIISIFTSFKTNTVGLWEDAEKLFTDILTEIQEIRDFSIDVKWKTRVIHGPKAVETIKKLADVPHALLEAGRDLVRQLKTTMNAEAAEDVIDDLEGVEDLAAIIKKLGPRVAQAFEKILGYLTLVLNALETIHGVVNDLQSVVDQVKEVTTDLKNLDGFFLPQKNKRQRITGKTYERLGHLHATA
jgi:methyl-accepting chemotaxis protein